MILNYNLAIKFFQLQIETTTCTIRQKPITFKIKYHLQLYEQQIINIYYKLYGNGVKSRI